MQLNVQGRLTLNRHQVWAAIKEYTRVNMPDLPVAECEFFGDMSLIQIVPPLYDSHVEEFR